MDFFWFGGGRWRRSIGGHLYRRVIRFFRTAATPQITFKWFLELLLNLKKYHNIPVQTILYKLWRNIPGRIHEILVLDTEEKGKTVKAIWIRWPNRIWQNGKLNESKMLNFQVKFCWANLASLPHVIIQACAEKKDCFAKPQPGVAGCGRLQPGRHFFAT